MVNKEDLQDLLIELNKYDYMEKDGYCLDHKCWYDGTEEMSIHSNCNYLNNYCETTDVEGAKTLLKYFLVGEGR